MAPKCGSTTIAKYMNLNLHIQYNQEQISSILKNDDWLKIIIIRKNVCERFLSGFYEDLFNNNCYNNIHITFEQYLDFLYYCFNNKIKNVSNLNIFFNEDIFIDWGNCSNKSLTLTNNKGEFISHIQSQKFAIERFINTIEGNNIKLIELKNLNNILNNNIKMNVKNKNYSEEITELKLSEIKKNRIIISELFLTQNQKKIINQIYQEDNIFISNLEKKYEYIK